MITGIILAAGKSSRMGQPKQLLPFRGNTILGCTVENARKSNLRQVIVVLGHAAERVRRAVDLTGVDVIVNHNYHQGQSTSLRAGLEAVAPDSHGAMFLLGDQPLVEATVINQLIESYRSSPAAIIIPTYFGQRGNPVLIARELFPLLEMLTGDQGARVLFDRYATHIREVEVPSRGIITDVDNWQDYLKLHSKGDG